MTKDEYDELLAIGRAKCRESETAEFENENKFKYNARTYWWEFLEKSQKYPVGGIMSFREFWDNEETYPRTIAM